MTHIYDALAPALGIGNAVALFLLVVLLLFGPTRKFWVVFVYVAWELLATIGLTLFDLLLNGTAQLDHATDAGRLYARIYWTNDVIVDLLRFVLVLVLIYKVAAGSSKALIGRLLAGVVLAMMVLPFVLFQPIFQPAPHQVPTNFNSQLLNLVAAVFGFFPIRGAFLNSTSQLLNFGAAVMNLFLWGALIQSKKRDPQILAVSVGLGILVTGSAVSYGLRHFAAPEGSFIAIFNLFLNLTQLVAWLIWCRAFWPAPSRKMPGGEVPSP